MTPPSAVRIRDIAPRLAFQAHHATTAQKLETASRLADAGISAIELSSFVRPDLVPGLADAAEVFAKISRRPGLSLECCVGNVRGLRRAIDAGADAAWFLLSADEGFARGNTGRSTAQSLTELGQMRVIAESSGIRLGTYVIFAWGGPSGPPRRPADLEPLARRLVDLGVTRWILADSTGYAAPPQTRELIEAAARHIPLADLTIQIHDARGMGLANIAEAIRAGVSRIDTSLAGSGAHPAMPDVPGAGVCTEDVVQMLQLMGVDTGIRLPPLIEAANWLHSEVGVPSKGFVRRAGPVPGTPHDRQHITSLRWQPLRGTRDEEASADRN